MCDIPDRNAEQEAEQEILEQCILANGKDGVADWFEEHGLDADAILEDGDDDQLGLLADYLQERTNKQIHAELLQHMSEEEIQKAVKERLAASNAFSKAMNKLVDGKQEG